MLNFKIRQFKRIGGGWGSIDKVTGQWNGMISNLINGEADILTSSLTICCRRTEVVEYLWTLSLKRTCFGIKGLFSG